MPQAAGTETVRAAVFCAAVHTGVRLRAVLPYKAYASIYDIARSVRVRGGYGRSGCRNGRRIQEIQIDSKERGKGGINSF